MITTNPRELTRFERIAIKKLVTEMCANFDREYGCLPLDCDCYMLNKWWSGNYCKYFQRSVLPIDPILEASLFGNKTPIQDTCSICNKPFIPDGRQFYCSTACKVEGNRHRSRERMRKKRLKT
ncbi:MAG: cysteine-rich VLP domain-containing protein [Defluviitaleaceae bacterium]|nr:cysteine-rich VLP domain-containing protein [Defluviitaleaceae bacterium]